MAMLETQRTYPNGYLCQVSSEISNNSLENLETRKLLPRLSSRIPICLLIVHPHVRSVFGVYIH